jgi:hypothetical protein
MLTQEPDFLEAWEAKIKLVLVRKLMKAELNQTSIGRRMRYNNMPALFKIYYLSTFFIFSPIDDSHRSMQNAVEYRYTQKDIASIAA